MPQFFPRFEVYSVPSGASLVAQTVENLPAMWETWVWYLDQNIPWRREWLSTPVFLPGESHGQRSLGGYSPWGLKELNTTEGLPLSLILLAPSLIIPFLIIPGWLSLWFWELSAAINCENVLQVQIFCVDLGIWPPEYGPCLGPCILLRQAGW